MAADFSNPDYVGEQHASGRSFINAKNTTGAEVKTLGYTRGCCVPPKKIFFGGTQQPLGTPAEIGKSFQVPVELFTLT